MRGAFRLVVIAIACGSGCTRVDNGAVELSWRLRPASGPHIDPSNPFVDCTPSEPGTGTIAQIRLTWQVADVIGSSAWPCKANTGVTGFDLPAGAALLAIEPVCEACPATTGTYSAPAPVQRDVIAGDTVILGAVEIVVQVSECSSARSCICAACPTM